MTHHDSGTRPAPRGCLGLLVLPVLAAQRVFRPRRPGRVSDPAVDLAQRARTATGLAATAWLLYAYPVHQTAVSAARDQMTSTLQAAGVLAVAGPAALLCFVAAARPPARAQYLRRLAGPLAAFTSLAGCLAAAWYLLPYGGAQHLASRLGPAHLAGLVAGLAAGLCAAFFAAAGIALAVHHVFRAADVHETLPPLLSALLAWTLALLQVLQPSDATAPPWSRLLFLLAPPVSVTALSLWELRRMRTSWGITIRTALHRGPVRPEV